MEEGAGVVMPIWPLRGVVLTMEDVMVTDGMGGGVGMSGRTPPGERGTLLLGERTVEATDDKYSAAPRRERGSALAGEEAHLIRVPVGGMRGVISGTTLAGLLSPLAVTASLPVGGSLDGEVVGCSFIFMALEMSCTVTPPPLPPALPPAWGGLGAIGTGDLRADPPGLNKARRADEVGEPVWRP